MNRLRILTCSIIISIFLLGCDRVLEPVLFNGLSQANAQSEQEEFAINIESLTFSSASVANQYPYKRNLMLTGSGSQANVLSESELLKSNLPNNSKKPDYLIGIGDVVSFRLESEFENTNPKWPKYSPLSEYLIGVGDELTFIRQRPLVNGIPQNDTLLVTKGVVGTDGNILLLGLGNIGVGNRSINDIRTEVRNILIRDGLTPNFQLEITGFFSKKAYLTSGKIETTITINNLPKTLQETVLAAGISLSSQNKSIITLSRDSKDFRTTAKQLLETTHDNIYIRDKDIIYIETVSDKPSNHESTVDTKGYILLPKIGKIYVLGKPLTEIQQETSHILSDYGLKPKFQLELSKFNSKAAYITINNKTIVIPLTNKGVTLRELLLRHNNTSYENKGLNLLTLKRDGKKYQSSTEHIIDPKSNDIWIQNSDQLEVKTLNYKPGQVFALSGSKNANIVTINPSIRETLADILFKPGGALNNIFAKRSEVYLLRGRNPSKAYHLDAQNVSRILVAAKTELRPNDIIFVAERPIISFSRTLSEISPLRILLRDIQNDKIP